MLYKQKKNCDDKKPVNDFKFPATAVFFFQKNQNILTMMKTSFVSTHKKPANAFKVTSSMQLYIDMLFSIFKSPPQKQNRDNRNANHNDQ